MIKICTPALIYIVFSLTQIVIDTFKGHYNTAFIKMCVSILITILLDGLCKSGMNIISWIIVFIPFIFMTFIVTILLYIFGLDVTTGKMTISYNKETPITNENNSNNMDKQNTPIPNFASSSPQYESFQ